MDKRYILILFFLLTVFNCSFSQNSSLETQKTLLITSDSTRLDSLSIIPSSFQLLLNKIPVNDSLFELDFVNATLIWKGEKPVTLNVKYTTFNINLSFKTQHKGTSLIQERYVRKNPFRINTKENEEFDLLGLSSLNKSGSISRGITVGNSQDLSVNSNFNLQLSGKIADNINVLASITDNNIPIQPDGNTQQLQDFDKVFIQLYNNDWQLTAGDFMVQSTNSYFMRYQKKSKGISFLNTFKLKDSNSFYTQGSASISRGKFATNTFQGIEGNQGPYKLTGAENEQLIIILSATEQVFIDGKLLKRGAAEDYTIDYNSAEIIFTPKQLITKNKRIVVQFQYSDKNYIRSLTQAEVRLNTKKWNSSIHVYSEQDHKNQPLQQTLNDPEKLVLFNAGDNINNTFIAREDTASLDENVVRYKKVDTLGYRIFAFAEDTDSNLFKVNFSNVGSNNGDYIQDGFSVFGRVYKWVKPDTVSGIIIRNGNYAPVVLLIAPKKKQMITFENNFTVNQNVLIETDLALSNTDINTFSTINNTDNVGVGGNFKIKTNKSLSNKPKPWVFNTNTHVEFINKDFNPIERYRSIEFSRDWNILNQQFDASQLVGSFNTGFTKKNLGKFNYSFNVLDVTDVYRGYKNQLDANIKKNNFDVAYNGKLLFSESNQNTNFYRHKALVEKTFKHIKIGYSDEVEDNKFKINDSLLNSSYSFYDTRLYIANSDSSANQYKLYVGYRDEKNTQSSSLKRAAFSNDVGLDYNLMTTNKKTRLKGNIAYRKLTIVDTTIGKAPENTFLNQTNFNTTLLKRLFTLNTFYEIGSGLEQKREFVYIEVNPGQGSYAWIDYNDNGIKELNEFEIAAFVDQANYIRIFTQSNQYIKTFSNKFSQSVSINPSQILRKKKGFLLKKLAKLSSVTAYKTERKTNEESFESSLNPFKDNITDSNLVSVNKQFRSSVFFNRTGYKYGLSYSFQDTRSKALLSNGFDSRQNKSHEIKGRYKLKKILFNTTAIVGEKKLFSDFLANRNYTIEYSTFSPSVAYQKDVNQTVSLVYTYQEKTNKLDLDFAAINTLGTEITYNIINNTSLSSRLSYVKIVYNGSENSSLEYEMLEGLKKGDNFTWELLLNKRIAKNLSITLSYNGRKPEGIKTIHTGTVEMRAFF